MCFDDPIYLDKESFAALMSDTEQHRICWMYHDVLSDPKIAWMFDRYAGKGTPIQRKWTTMAWVAAGRQENSFYLLFKWYADFYGPPQRGDLYFIEREQGPDGEVRARFLNMDFQNKLDARGQAWCQSFWRKVSMNATSFFGETDFESNVVSRLLRHLEANPGREMETFDWYLRGRNDGEKFLQCATIAAYFRSIQAIEEIIYKIVVTDGGENDVHHMHTRELVEILNRIADTPIIERRRELGEDFQALAEQFLDEPVRAPFLGRGVGRILLDRMETDEIRWCHLSGLGARRLLRELYFLCDCRRVWDVFHRWQGEVFFTVIQRPKYRGIRRGVYLMARFEDQTGADVTNLFLLENVSSGVAHLCEGEFFDDLMDRLLMSVDREVSLPGFGLRGEDLLARCYNRLKQSFSEY